MSQAGLARFSSGGGGGGTITSVVTTNATPQFVLTGSTETINFAASSNLVLGSSLPLLTSGVSNTGLGLDVLKFTTSGQGNTGVGAGCLDSLNTGLRNTCGGAGSGSGITSGVDNTAWGEMSLFTASTASDCVAIGADALANCNQNGITAVGLAALNALTSGIEACAIGFQALTRATGDGNTAGGYASMFQLTSGQHNTAWGKGSGANFLTGSTNLFLGYNTGNNYVGAESSNILLQNLGVASESNKIRIGTQGVGAGQQNSCFIAGIAGVTTSNTEYVTIDTTTGELGSTSSAGGGVTSIATINSTAQFTAGPVVTIQFAVNNLALGTDLPNLTSGTSNCFYGQNAGPSTTSASSCVGIGNDSLNSNDTSSFNVAVGTSSLTFLSGGSGQNVSIGEASLFNLNSGAYNIGIGTNVGLNYSSTESSNIVIGNQGEAGESNTIRIGTQGSGDGEQDQVFIAGIAGTTTSNSMMVTVDSTTGQLGELAIPGGGSPVNFQAYRTSNQTVAGGSTSTTIVFDTTTSNVGSAYNTSTGIFTAPDTGFYCFNSTVYFNSLTGPAGISQVILGYTGSVQSLRLIQQGIGSAVTATALILTASFAMPMTAGDTIQIQPFTDGTGNYQIAGAALSSGAFNTASTFSGFKVA